MSEAARNLEPEYLTLAQAASIGPYTAKQLSRKIHDGTFIEGVHFTRPFRSHPVILRDGFLAYVNGVDAELRQPKRRNHRGKVNWEAA